MGDASNSGVKPFRRRLARGARYGSAWARRVVGRGGVDADERGGDAHRHLLNVGPSGSLTEKSSAGWHLVSYSPKCGGGFNVEAVQSPAEVGRTRKRTGSPARGCEVLAQAVLWETPPHTVSLSGSSPERGDDETDEAMFSILPHSLSSSARKLSRARPQLCRLGLWAALVFLVAGEFAVTALWVWAAGWRACWVLCAPVALLWFLVALYWGRGPALIFVLSMASSAVSSLPSYTGAALIVGREEPQPDKRISTGVRPAMIAVGVLELFAALGAHVAEEKVLSSWKCPQQVETLTTEGPGRRTTWSCSGAARSLRTTASAIQAAVEGLQASALQLCALYVWVHCAILVNATVITSIVSAVDGSRSSRSDCLLGHFSFGPNPNTSPWAPSTQETAVVLHAACLFCGRARRTLVRALGGELVPLLLGVKRAEKLTLRSLLRRHAKTVMRAASHVHDSVPPTRAVLVAVFTRRAAPFLLPLVAALVEASVSWGQLVRSAAFVGAAALTLGALAASVEGGYLTLPGHPAMRLTLLPAGLSRAEREISGVLLVWAARVAPLFFLYERARRVLTRSGRAKREGRQ
jgi:hypothetical protein